MDHDGRSAGAVTPVGRERELIAAGMDKNQTREVAIEDQGRVTRGLLAEPAVTRELTPAEQENLEQARIARGEDPRPTISPEHRARLEADRAAAQRDEVLVPTGTPKWLGATLRLSSLPTGARAECTTFRSGAVDLVIRHGDHLAVIQGMAGDEWGWSVDPPADQGFMGHDNVAASLAAALAAVAQRLAAP